MLSFSLFTAVGSSFYPSFSSSSKTYKASKCMDELKSKYGNFSICKVHIFDVKPESKWLSAFNGRHCLAKILLTSNDGF